MTPALLVADRPLVTICGWCPSVEARTAELQAQGLRVSHGLCAACAARLDAELDAVLVFTHPQEAR